VLERHTENFNLGKSWLIGDQTNALPQAQLRHLNNLSGKSFRPELVANIRNEGPQLILPVLSNAVPA
jgi:hypothetical protein